MIQDMIEKFKQWKGNKDAEAEEEEPPREIRDKQLESLEREHNYHLMQERKQFLKERLAEIKKEKLREGLFGRFDNESKYLGENVQQRKVDIMNRGNELLKQKTLMKQNNILKQKSILSEKSLLNNRKREFKQKKMKFI